MTNKEFINSTKDSNKLADFLFNFAIAFHNEDLTGICGDSDCFDNSCIDCLEWWLDAELDVKLVRKSKER